MLNFNRIMKVTMVVCVSSLFTLNNAYSQTGESPYDSVTLGETVVLGTKAKPDTSTDARKRAEQELFNAVQKSGIQSDAVSAKDKEKLQNAEKANKEAAAKKAAAKTALDAALAKQEAVKKAEKALAEAKTPAAKAQAEEVLKSAKSAAPEAGALNSLQKEFNSADNAAKKTASSLASAQTKVGKVAQKDAGKEASKAAKKVREKEKALEKAKKSGDEAAINKAQEDLNAAKGDAAKANQKLDDFDGSKAVAAAEANLNQAIAVEAIDVARKEARQAAERESVRRHTSCNVEVNVFAKLTCKATMFLADVRVLVYVLGGFGLIAFTFKAIFGKMDWKHLGQLGLSLFLLSMMVPFITYFTSDNDSQDYSSLKYGEFLPYDTAAILRSTDLDARNAVKAPEAVNTTKEKYGLKDILGSVKAGIAAVKGAYDTVNTAKVAVKEAKKNAAAIGNAIKNHKGGLGGLVATVDNVAAAGGNMVYAGTQMANAVNRNVGAVANNFDDMKATNQQREENAKIREKGGFTNEIDAWMKDEYGVMADVKEKTQKVNEKSGQIRTATSNVSNATKQGATMGGGMGSTGGNILGGLMGVATAVGEGSTIGSNWNGTEAQKAAEQAKYTGVQSGGQKAEQLKDVATDIAGRNKTSKYINESGEVVSQNLASKLLPGSIDNKTYANIMGSVKAEKKEGKDVYTFNGKQYDTAQEATKAAANSIAVVDQQGGVYKELLAKKETYEKIKEAAVITGEKVVAEDLTANEKAFMKNYDTAVKDLNMKKDSKGNIVYTAPAPAPAPAQKAAAAKTEAPKPDTATANAPAQTGAAQSGTTAATAKTDTTKKATTAKTTTPAAAKPVASTTHQLYQKAAQKDEIVYEGGEKGKVAGDTFSFISQKTGSIPSNPQYNPPVNYKKQADGNFYVQTGSARVAIFDSKGKLIDEVYDYNLTKTQQGYVDSGKIGAAVQAGAAAGVAVLKK